MIIIIGLGNPGKKFENTPHNVGFLAVKKFSDNYLIAPVSDQTANYIKIKDVINEEEINLIFPQTYMNLSGNVFRYLQKDYRLKIIVHDDIDIPMGKIKLSQGGRSGGHKGVESIIRVRGENFIRIKIGILPPNGKPKELEKFVLKKISKEQRKIIDEGVQKATKAIDLLIKEGLDRAMNEYNK